MVGESRVFAVPQNKNFFPNVGKIKSSFQNAPFPLQVRLRRTSCERESQVFSTGPGMIAARISRNRKEVSMQTGLQWATCLYDCTHRALPSRGAWDSVSLFLQHSKELKKWLILQLGANTEGVPKSFWWIKELTPALSQLSYPSILEEVW